MNSRFIYTFSWFVMNNLELLYNYFLSDPQYLSYERNLLNSLPGSQNYTTAASWEKAVWIKMPYDENSKRFYVSQANKAEPFFRCKVLALTDPESAC